MSCFDSSENISVLHCGVELSIQTFHFKLVSVETMYKFNKAQRLLSWASGYSLNIGRWEAFLFKEGAFCVDRGQI